MITLILCFVLKFSTLESTDERLLGPTANIPSLILITQMA